jgi:hypothetical protein
MAPPPTTGHTPKTRHEAKKPTKKLLDLSLIHFDAQPRPTPASYSSGAALRGPVNGKRPSRVL